MPFIANATAVSGPSSGWIALAMAGSEGAFNVTMTTSCGPSCAGSSLAFTGTRNVASAARTSSPFACIAARWGPRATTETSAPPRASLRRRVPADGAGAEHADLHDSRSSAIRDSACTPPCRQPSSGW